jgi:hypothetical protein
MSERSTILRDPQNMKDDTAVNTTLMSRLMGFLIRKFDAVASLFYKMTND